MRRGAIIDGFGAGLGPGFGALAGASVLVPASDAGVGFALSAGADGAGADGRSGSLETFWLPGLFDSLLASTCASDGSSISGSSGR